MAIEFDADNYSEMNLEEAMQLGIYFQLAHAAVDWVTASPEFERFIRTVAASKELDEDHVSAEWVNAHGYFQAVSADIAMAVGGKIAAVIGQHADGPPDAA